MPPPPIAVAAPRVLAPVRLPQRLDGQRLDHLSASSLAKFWRCPEAWRAHYLARVRGPESAELRRGWVVDAAIEAHFKSLLATGEPLPQRDIEDIYAAAWQRRIDDAAIEIDWGDDTPEHVKDTGLIALRAYLAELAPTVRPTSVQREFAFALPAAWTSRTPTA